MLCLLGLRRKLAAMIERAAISEGYIGEIFKLFIRPLLRFKPETMSLQMYMEMLFHADTREIKRYITREPMTMPGLLCVAPHVKYQGVGYREVGSDQTLWVRTDITRPEAIEIEWLGSGKEQVFYLNLSEWNSIAPNLLEG